MIFLGVGAPYINVGAYTHPATFNVVDYSGFGGNTITVTVDAVPTVLTEGTDFTAGTSNLATAAAIAAAINANSVLSAKVVANDAKVIVNSMFNVVDWTLGAGDTITLTVDGVATVLTEGVSPLFVAAVSNAVTATNIAAAINANAVLGPKVKALAGLLGGVSVVRVLRKGSHYSLVVATGDATAWTVTQEPYIGAVSVVPKYGYTVVTLATNDTPYISVTQSDSTEYPACLHCRNSYEQVNISAWSGDGTTVTLTTEAHLFEPMADITIHGLVVGAALNGRHTISAVPDNTHIQFLSASAPGVSETGTVDPVSVDILPTVGPPWTYLASGAVTVGASLSLACQKSGAKAYAEATKITVGGTDITKHCLTAPAWNWRDGDKIATFTLQTKADQFGFLDNAAADANQSVLIERLIRGEGVGAATWLDAFTGRVKSAGMTFDRAGRRVSTLLVESESGRWDRKEIEMTITCEANAYNCVLADAYDECLVRSMNSPNWLYVEEGLVIVDTTQLGKMGNYGGGSGTWTGGSLEGMGGSNGGQSWPWHTNSGGEYQGGGLLTIHIPAQIVDLTTRPDIHLNDEDYLGLKHLYVDHHGWVWASDEGPPVNAVPLACWEHLAVGDIIAQNDLIDTRLIVLGQQQRFRSGLAEYVIRKAGFTTTNIVWPTKYNDAIFGNVRITKKSLLLFLDQWFRPSRWRWWFDGSGQFRVSVNEILPDSNAYPHWSYNEHNSIVVDITGPELGQFGAAGDVTVRGQSTWNAGLVKRKETSEIKTYAKKPIESTLTGAALGGNYLPYTGYPRRPPLRLMQVDKETQTLIGRSTIMIEKECKRRKNPLLIGPNCIAGDRIALGPGDYGDSEENAINYRYGLNPQMEKESESVLFNEYESRILTGTERQELRKHLPMTHNATTGIGYPGAGGVAVLGRYGWTRREEEMELMAVDQTDYDVGSSGLINKIFEKQFRRYNPHVENEGYGGPKKYGAAVVGSLGYHKEEEELCLVLSKSTRYDKVPYDNKLLRTTVNTETWEKKASRMTNSTGKVGARDPSHGSAQGEVSGKVVETDVSEATRPAAQTLADHIDRHEVFCRITHPIVQAAYGTENKIDERVPYVETYDQARRVAEEIMGQRLCLQIAAQVPVNPLMEMYQTALITLRSPQNRTFTQRARIVGIGPKLALKRTDPDGQTVIMEADYNRSRAYLATRT